MSNTISHRSPECKPLLMYKQSGATAIMSIKGPKAPAEHVRAQPSDEEEEQAKVWVAWGTSDDFPETVAKLIRKSTVDRAVGNQPEAFQRVQLVVGGAGDLARRVKVLDAHQPFAPGSMRHQPAADGGDRKSVV